MDYSKLASGQTVSCRSYRLDADTVAAYVEAVDDRSDVGSRANGSGVAPPMAIAALTLRGVVQDLGIPPGTLHTGQELQFNRAVRIGEALACHATIAQNSVRGGRRFVVVRLQADDSCGRPVLEGKSTLVLPQ